MGSVDEFADLRREVERLRAENARLGRLLDLRGQDTTAAPEQMSALVEPPGLVTMASPTRDKLAPFTDRFRARADVYAVRWENTCTGAAGWMPAVAGGWRKGVDRRGATYLPRTAEAVAAHLVGDVFMGLHPLMPDNSCHFVVADFDGPTAMLDALAYVKAARASAVPAALEISQSGRGARVAFGLATVAAVLAAAAPSPAQLRPETTHLTATAAEWGDLLSRTGPAAVFDPGFTVQPQPQSVPDGSAVTFFAEFPGARIYTWYRTDAKGSVPLPNSNAADYTFTAGYADNGATYSVRVFDANFVQHRSEEALLTVTPVAATVTEPPHDTSVQAYQSAGFTVTAGGTGPYSYQWQRQDSAHPTWSDIAAATNADYAFKTRPGDDGAQFRVVVGNSHGPSTASSAATLQVTTGGGSLDPVDQASLEWGVNNIYQGGNPANTGCNFFSAGTQEQFQAEQGNVRDHPPYA